MGFGDDNRDKKEATIKPLLSLDRPLDQLATGLMQGIRDKGRGFVLDLAPTGRQALADLTPLKDELFEVLHSELNDGQNDPKLVLKLRDVASRMLDPLAQVCATAAGVQVEVKESLPPHDEWEPPVAYRDHTIGDTDSFIAYANRYGKQNESLVFYNDGGCTLVLNELVARGKRETIDMKFIQAKDFIEWSAILDKPMNHKQLYKFLQAHEHNLHDPALLLAIASIKATATVNFQSDLQDDGESVGMMFKTTAGEELKKFPKKLGINVPILEQDQDGDQLATATIKLEVAMPNSPTDVPTFTLYCSTWKQLLQTRVRKEGQTIRNGLSGWTVVNGTFRDTDRTLGR